MNDETGFLAAALKELLASTGGDPRRLGRARAGATNALTTKMRLRDALRHILLGGLIAAGMGQPVDGDHHPLARPAARGDPGRGAAGSAAYLVGVFGPAFIEVLLARLRHAGKGDGDA